MVVLHNQFLTILHTEDKILENIWQPESVNMQEQDFKDLLTFWMDYADSHSIEHFLVNTKDFAFPIVPTVQTWHDEYIVPRWETNYPRKFAFVVSSDFIAQLSIELTLDEQHAKELASQNTVRYFDTMQEAYKWLKIPNG